MPPIRTGSSAIFLPHALMAGALRQAAVLNHCTVSHMECVPAQRRTPVQACLLCHVGGSYIRCGKSQDFRMDQSRSPAFSKKPACVPAGSTRNALPARGQNSKNAAPVQGGRHLTDRRETQPSVSARLRALRYRYTGKTAFRGLMVKGFSLRRQKFKWRTPVITSQNSHTDSNNSVIYRIFNINRTCIYFTVSGQVYARHYPCRPGILCRFN